MRVLVVDDNTDFLRAVRLLLRQLGHEAVGLARCGDEALALAAGLDPDVVLIDLDTPDEDGSRTARRLKSRQAVPVIALGRQSDEAFHHRALDAGCDAFIPKGDLAADLPRVLLRLDTGRRETAPRARRAWTAEPEPAHV